MLTISEFARLGQVSPRMLRYYGETGLLAPARIDVHTGYRFYGVAQPVSRPASGVSKPTCGH